MAEEKRHTIPAPSPTGELLTDHEQETQQAEGTTIPSARQRTASFFKTLLFTIVVAFILKVFVVEAFRIPSGSMENTLLVGDFLLVNKLAYGLRTPRYLPLTNLSMPSFVLPLFRTVRRGDVVVFEFPGKHNGEQPTGPEYYIKRCIGLPGDTVTMQAGYVMVNGREVLLPSHAKSSMVAPTIHADLTPQRHPSSPAIDGNNFGPTIVPRKGDVLRLTSSMIASWKMFIEREHHDVEVSSLGVINIDGVEASRYCIEHDYYFMLGDNRGNSLDSRYWGFVPDDHILGEALLLYWSWDPERAGDEGHYQSASIRWSRIGTLVR